MADAEERSLLDELGELVRLESPSGDVERLDALRDLLVAKLDAAGAAASVAPGAAGDHILATVEGRGSAGGHLVVLGHYDTVWPVGRLAEAPFAVRDGSATGPGVFDMKAGLAILLWALRRLDDGPARSLRIVLTADEEVGSPSGGAVVREACAGAAAALALEPPLPNGRLKVGRRGVSRVLVSVTGREAHAGLQRAAGVSAVDELLDQLLTIRHAVPDSAARSVNVGRIHGGTRANVVAGHAEAELGLRFANDAEERAIRTALDALAPVREGAHVTVRTLSHRPAWEPSGSQQLAAHVVTTALALGERVDTGVSGGAGDANLTGAAGVPTVDGLGPRGRGAHARNEAVEVASLLPRARLLHALLREPLPV